MIEIDDMELEDEYDDDQDYDEGDVEENLFLNLHPSDQHDLTIILSKYPNYHQILSQPEERALIQRAQRGDQTAWSTLIEVNIRLILREVRRFRLRNNIRPEHPTLSLRDLAQEGLLGLIKAIGKFEIKRGFRLSTYATWWIRQAIQRAIFGKSRTIRVPVYMMESFSHVNREYRVLEDELGHPPSGQQLAARLGITEAELFKLSCRMEEVWSLDASLRPQDGESETLGEMLSEKTDGPNTLACLADLQTKVWEALTKLPPREQDVLRLRFGLDDGWARTLEEVGQHFGITRERVRQIENNAKNRMRKLLPEFKNYIPES